jgi:hypothetical protein
MPPELPAYLQNDGEQFAVDTLTQNLGVGMPPYVSIAENRFKLVDGAGDEEPITTVDPKTGIPYFDACIIDWNEHPSKVFFSRPYDPNDPSPPDCWSDNGVAPSINAASPQHATCDGCPKAVWGSATSKVSGKGVPACNKTQKLALALPDDDVVFLLRVPPNSLENLRAYTKKFQGQKVSVASVMTRISFEKGVIGTLTFAATAYIDQKMATFRNKIRAEKGTDAMVGRTDRPRLTAGEPVKQVAGGPLSPGGSAQNAASQSTTTAPAQTQIAGPVQAASPSSPPQAGEPAPTGRRRSRPKAEPAAGGLPDPNAQAPFRPTPPPGGQAAPSPAAGGFGIQNGAAPDAAITAELDALFS